MPLLQDESQPHDLERGCSLSSKSQKDKEAAELTKEELLPIALSFYELQQTHVIHEEDPDTKVQSQPSSALPCPKQKGWLH